jgi:hypothetical protein
MIGNFPFPQKDWNGLPVMEWFTKLISAINGALNNIVSLLTSFGSPPTYWQKARAWASNPAGQVMTELQWNQVLINTVSFDPSSIVDAATNHCIKPTLPGYYLVTGNVGATVPCYAGLSQNGATPADAPVGDANQINETSDLMYFGGTDSIALMIYPGASGGALTNTARENFLAVVGPF